MLQNSILRDAARNPIWQEESGRLVIPVDTVPLPGLHSKESSFKGIWNEWIADSPGEYCWGGPELPWNPGAGILPYRFHIEAAGNYTVAVHNRSDKESGISCFVRIDGGQWWIMTGDGEISWKWSEEREIGPSEREKFRVFLEQGFHQIELSGRSQGFRLDLVALTRDGSDKDEAISQARPR